MRLLALVGGLLLAGSSVYAHSEGQKIDGRKARPMVVRALEARNLSSNVLVRGVKGKQGVVVTKASGTVRTFVIRDNRIVVLNGKRGILRQSTARGTANQMMRRDPGLRWGKRTPGSFAGVNSAGVSVSGKSYRFNSATDRRGANVETVYVSVTTGKTRVYDRGQ